jgi:hypothetical protein
MSVYNFILFLQRLPFAVDCELPGDERGTTRKDGSSIDQNSNQLANQSNQLLPPPFFQQISGEHTQQQSSHQQAQHQQQQQQHQQNILNLLSQHQQDGQNPFGLPLNFPVQGGGFQPHPNLADAVSIKKAYMFLILMDYVNDCEEIKKNLFLLDEYVQCSDICRRS